MLQHPTRNYQNWQIGANHDGDEVAPQVTNQQSFVHMAFSQLEYGWADFEKNGIKFPQETLISKKIPNEISNLVGMMTDSVAHTLLKSSKMSHDTKAQDQFINYGSTKSKTVLLARSDSPPMLLNESNVDDEKNSTKFSNEHCEQASSGTHTCNNIYNSPLKTADMVICDQRSNESSLTTGSDLNSDDKNKIICFRPRRKKQIGKRKVDGNGARVNKHMSVDEKKKILVRNLKKKKKSDGKINPYMKKKPQDIDLSSNTFIKGEIPNFWQCPYCHILPIHERAKHSVLYHGGSEPPTVKLYPVIDYHFSTCEAKKILEQTSFDLSSYNIISKSEIDSSEDEMSSDNSEINSSTKKRKVRRKERDGGRKKKKQRVLHFSNDTTMNDSQKKLDEQSENASNMDITKIGLPSYIFAVLSRKYLEIMSPLELEIAWIGEKRMMETKGRWLDWEFIMKNCSSSLERFFTNKIHQNPDKYKNHKMDVFIRNKARSSFNQIRIEIRPALRRHEERVKLDDSKRKDSIQNEEKVEPLIVTEKSNTDSHGNISDKTISENKNAESSAHMEQTSQCPIEIPQPTHNLTDTVNDQKLTASIDIYLLSQVDLCFYKSSSDQTNRTGNQVLTENLPGVECKYCLGTKRRFYFKNEKSVSKDLPKMEHHILGCRGCPKEVKEMVIMLRARQDSERNALRRNAGFCNGGGKYKFTRKQFGSTIWRRLNETET